MAVAHVADISGNGTSSPVDSGSFTVGAESDRLIGVEVAIAATGTAPTVSAAFDPTSSNQALSEVAAPSGASNLWTCAYALADPTAATGVVQVSVTPGGGGSLFALWVRGVFVSGADSAADPNSATGSDNAPTVSISNATVNDMLVAAFVGPQETYTTGDGLTVIGADANGSIFKGGGRYKATPANGSIAIGWTGTGDTWRIGGFRIVAAAGGASTVPVKLGSFRRRRQ